MNNNQQQSIQVITSGPFSSKMVQLSKVMAQHESHLNSLLVSINPRISKVADEAFSAYATLIKQLSKDIEAISSKTNRSANPARNKQAKKHPKNNASNDKANTHNPKKNAKKVPAAKKQTGKGATIKLDNTDKKKTTVAADKVPVAAPKVTNQQPDAIAS